MHRNTKSQTKKRVSSYGERKTFSFEERAIRSIAFTIVFIMLHAWYTSIHNFLFLYFFTLYMIKQF